MGRGSRKYQEVAAFKMTVSDASTQALVQPQVQLSFTYVTDQPFDMAGLDLMGDDEDVPGIDYNSPVPPDQQESNTQRSSNVSQTLLKIRNKGQKLKWKKKNLQPPDDEVPAAVNTNQLKRPIDYFMNYFSNDFFESAAKYTNMYHLSKTGRELKASASEIKKMFGMHMYIGCLTYPRIRMYWNNKYSLTAVSEVMPRDRFFLLRNNLHVVDRNSPLTVGNNRLWKVQPVLDAVRDACLKIERVKDDYSIDEQMVPFTGRCQLKQYVANKPRPVGLKNFVVTTSTGLMVDFIMYQGQTTCLDEAPFGLGPSIVLQLVQTIPKGSTFYFDRYFTTLPLMIRLKKKGFLATGTVKGNLVKNVPLQQDKALKERGSVDERTASGISAVKWKDSKVVTMLSNKSGILPSGLVKRWSKSEKKYVEVVCPSVIKEYNKNMGGVDVLDQYMEYYRTWISCPIHGLFLSAGI